MIPDPIPILQNSEFIETASFFLINHLKKKAKYVRQKIDSHHENASSLTIFCCIIG